MKKPASRKRKRKNKNGKLLLKLTAALLAVSVICFASFFFTKPQIRFIAADITGKIGGKVVFKASDESEYDLTKVSVAKLKHYENVTFNQALMLINTENTIDSDFKANISEYEDSEVYMNECVKASYKRLKEAAFKETGEDILITSAYRDAEKQSEIKEEKGAAAQSVGASEHQSGLALDLCIQYYGGEAFLKSEAGQFVNSKCADYGFIVRYPYYGKAETGISYEPWHLRYVGIPHAQIITRNSLTLEAYIESLEIDCYYEYDGYLISRQSGKSLNVPEHFRNAVISPDNMGNYVVTVLL